VANLLVANPEIVFRQEEDEAMLFNPDTGGIKILNDTGSFIYQLLDGKHSSNDIVDLLIMEYDALSREQAEQDLNEFLETMLHAQLIGELL
jgi:hypothetical protein